MDNFRITFTAHRRGSVNTQISRKLTSATRDGIIVICDFANLGGPRCAEILGLAETGFVALQILFRNETLILKLFFNSVKIS